MPKKKVISQITRFQTEKNEDQYEYIDIANTEDGKLHIFLSKQFDYQQYGNNFILDESLRITAVCKKEDLIGIIMQKIKNKQIEIGKNNDIILKFESADFYTINDVNKNKYGIDFPFYMHFTTIKEQIFNGKMPETITGQINEILFNGKQNTNKDIKEQNDPTLHQEEANNHLEQKEIQQPYYQQVWNEVFGGCCPCGLDSFTEGAEQAIT